MEHAPSPHTAESPVNASRYSAAWWALVFVHNVVVHPILPIADVAAAFGGPRCRRAAWIVFRLHDATIPKGAG